MRPGQRSTMSSVVSLVSVVAACSGIEAWAEETSKKPPPQPETQVSSSEYLSGVASTARSFMGSRSSRANPADVAGEIFGVPVSMANYLFAKRVAYLFPRPWGAADLPEDQREEVVWESLILHYEAFRQGVEATEDELDAMINALLKDQQLLFTRKGDPEAYKRWATETLQEDVELLENQVRFLIQLRKLKDQVRQAQQVTVTEDDMQQEFFNEKHHVGGEMVVFDTKEQARAFYEQVKDPKQWEAMKTHGEHQIKPVSLMTLEAYMDLWGIPKEQMYAFHAMELGSIGPPMPFGRQWCVYRLLDKRTGKREDFPAERASYAKQVEMKKKYEALKRWLEELNAAAHLKVFVDDQRR